MSTAPARAPLDVSPAVSGGPLPLEAALTKSAAPRLMSLDVFRGLVILSMLLVNNLGDYTVVGYFWKHADWKPVSLGADLAAWWGALTSGSAGLLNSLTTFPLLWHCTLADFVMPMFMLIIGVAMPFSAAAARAKGDTGAGYWLRVLRRGGTLYLLGWIIGLSIQFQSWRFDADPGKALSLRLGMDVLQLLGVSYVVSRLLYCLPPGGRLVSAAVLFMWHWALLRFLPQGDTPAGTFTATHNAVGYLYSTLPIFGGFTIVPTGTFGNWGVSFSIAGMLSVPPAAATMLLGAWVGDTLRDPARSPAGRVKLLLIAGALTALGGVVWSLDLPMNKPRWSPAYLVYCSGLGAIGIAGLYWLIDARAAAGRTRAPVWLVPLIVLGVNAIGIYFLSILAKVWLLNMPRITPDGEAARPLTRHIILTLQSWTTPTVGSWLFTLGFVAVVWAAAALAYRRRWFWRV